MIARRVAGVVIAAALLMLGLAAPAFAAAPTISSFTPSSGPINCVVTITGTNFNNPNVTAVDFNGQAAASFTIVSGTEIRAVVDTGTTNGPIHVNNGTLATSSTNFTVASPGGCAPSISSFTPTCGPVGTAVTIFGTNLFTDDSTGGTVKFFNNKTASSSGVSPTQLSAFVPAGAATGAISVTTGVSPVANSSTNFTVSSSCATITSFTPTSGAVGTSVTITGTGFTGTTSVTFNNVNAPGFTVNGTGTQITVSVPTGATTGPIRVTSASGTATSSTNFTVTAAPLPTITSFTPTFGRVGTSVTINGTNFSGTGFTTTSVKFNNVTATFTVNSATMITTSVPATATTGKITVTTPGGTATSAADFIVSAFHSRSVTLSLVKHLVARGLVSVGDGFTQCVSSVPVKIQHRVSGHWRTVKTVTTGSGGSYRARIPDKLGKYRARATKMLIGGGADICGVATSPTRRNT